MGEIEKKLTGKGLTAMVVTVVVIISVVMSAWWFYLRPVSPGIKIGVIGPMEWVQGKGMWEGATLAAEEINNAGGVLVNETWYQLVLYKGDEGTEPATGTLAMERLITMDKVDFVMGGFRTEITFPMRDVAMDHKKVYLLTGSATTELIDCKGTTKYPCIETVPEGYCVRHNYERYKYVFRVTPPNVSVLFSETLVPFLKGYLIPHVMVPIYDVPVKVAVVVEKAAWTEYLRGLIENVGELFFGPLQSKIVYKGYPSPSATDFSAELTAIKDSGAQLIVHVFSGEAGQIFIKQWGERKIPAVPIGVNVLGQESGHWDVTEGKCEYEAFLSSPPRVGLSEKTVQFWDNYVERWGHDPIYTSFGTYDAMYILKEAIERAGSIDSDAVVAELEKTDTVTTFGKFKFTRTHDVFAEPSHTTKRIQEFPYSHYDWLSSEYVKPLIVQWRNGTKVVVYPFNQTYTQQFAIPPWMLPSA